MRESGASLGQSGYALARKRLRNSLSMRVSDNDDGMASGSEVVGRPRPRRLVIACSMAIAKLPQSTFGLVGWALITSGMHRIAAEVRNAHSRKGLVPLNKPSFDGAGARHHTFTLARGLG